MRKPAEFFKNHKREFKDKWANFQGLCHTNIPEGYCKIQVQRKYIFGSSYHQIMEDVLNLKPLAEGKSKRTPNEYRKRLFVTIDKEEGLDYGGVSREFFYLLSHEIANPNFGLFMHSQNY